MKTFKQFREAVWDQPNPNKGEGNKMSSAEKAEAKRRAKAAGRPYPNLVDNMAAMKEESCEMFDDSHYGIVEESFVSNGKELYEDWGEIAEENEGKTLNKPFLTPGGPKKGQCMLRTIKAML